MIGDGLDISAKHGTNAYTLGALGAASLVSAGLGIDVMQDSSTTTAELTDGSVTTKENGTGDVTVAAENATKDNYKMITESAGYFGASTNVSAGNFNAQTTAHVADMTIGDADRRAGAVDIHAKNTTQVTSDTWDGAVAGVGIGAGIQIATIGSDTDARVENSTVYAGTIGIAADDEKNGTFRLGNTLAGGLAGGVNVGVLTAGRKVENTYSITGGDGTAHDSGAATTTASVTGGTLDATGDVTVTSNAAVNVKEENIYAAASLASFSGQVGVLDDAKQATVNVTGANIRGKNVALGTQLGGTSALDSYQGALGGIDVSGAFAFARSANSQGVTLDGSTVTAGENVTVKTADDSTLKVHAYAVQPSLDVSASFQLAEADVVGATGITLGAGNEITAGKSIDIEAKSAPTIETDVKNTNDSLVFTGGVSVSTTVANNTANVVNVTNTTATADGAADGSNLKSVTIGAKQETTTTADASSYGGAIALNVSAAETELSHTGTTTANVSGTWDVAGDVNVTAENKENFDLDTDTASASIAGGSGGGLSKNVTQAAHVNLDGAAVTTTGAQTVRAENALADTSTMASASYGFLDSTDATKLSASGTYTGDVSLKNATLTANGGGITVTAATTGTHTTDNDINTGSIGVDEAVATTTNNLTYKNAVTLDGASVKTNGSTAGDVALAAYDATEASDTILAGTQTNITSETYNRTLLPFSTDPDIDAKLDQANVVTVGAGSSVSSVEDTAIAADKGGATEQLSARRYTLYDSGDGSITVTENGKETDDGKALNKAVIDGTVTAGAHDNAVVRITGDAKQGAANADGSYATDFSGVKVAVEQGGDWLDAKAFQTKEAEVANPFYEEYQSLVASQADYPAGTTARTNIESEIASLCETMERLGYADKKDGSYIVYETVDMAAVVLPDIKVSGGNVDIAADSLAVGSTGTVAAKNGTAIDVESSSNVALVVNDAVLTLTKPAASGGDASGIHAGGLVAISGHDVNLNGLVQSGYADFTVTLDDAAVAKINTIAANGKTLSDDDVRGNRSYCVVEGGSYYDTEAGCWKYQIPVYYNPTTQHLVTDDVNASGGSVTIKGRLASTGAAGSSRILVASGAANIAIDTTKAANDVSLGTITNRERTGIVSIADTAGGKTFSQTFTAPLATDATYAYDDGANTQRSYTWTGGVSTYTKTHYEHKENSWLGGLITTDGFYNQYEDPSKSTVTTEAGDGTTLSSATHIQDVSTTGASRPAFTVATELASSEDQRTDVQTTTHKKGLWGLIKTEYTYKWDKMTTTGTSTVYTVKGDTATHINSIAPASGSGIEATATGSLLVDHAITSAAKADGTTDAVTLTSRNGSVAGAGLITTNALTASAATGIDLTQAALAKSDTATVNLATHAGDITLASRLGDVAVQSAKSAEADGKGAIVRLTADAGSITNASQDTAINETPADALIAKWQAAGILSAKDAADSNAYASQDAKATRLAALEKRLEQLALRNATAKRAAGLQGTSYGAEAERTAAGYKAAAQAYAADETLTNARNLCVSTMQAATTADAVAAAKTTYKAAITTYFDKLQDAGTTYDADERTAIMQYGEALVERATTYGWKQTDLLSALSGRILDKQPGDVRLPDVANITGTSITLVAAGGIGTPGTKETIEASDLADHIQELRDTYPGNAVWNYDENGELKSVTIDTSRPLYVNTTGDATATDVALSSNGPTYLGTLAANDLTIFAGTGNIGTKDKPIETALTGALQANAEGTLYLNNTSDSMKLGGIAMGEEAVLAREGRPLRRGVDARDGRDGHGRRRHPPAVRRQHVRQRHDPRGRRGKRHRRHDPAQDDRAEYGQGFRHGRPHRHVRRRERRILAAPGREHGRHHDREHRSAQRPQRQRQARDDERQRHVHDGRQPQHLEGCRPRERGRHDVRRDRRHDRRRHRHRRR